MTARTALRICLAGALALALGGCTGGVFVQYPAFPDRSCGTCFGPAR